MHLRAALSLDTFMKLYDHEASLTFSDSFYSIFVYSLSNLACVTFLQHLKFLLS